MAIDYNQRIADMQAAMRALWPDRKVVYFTESSKQAMGPGPVLTLEEQALLSRVTRAIGAARNSEEQVARTTAAIEEAAVFDFLNWLVPQHIELAVIEREPYIDNVATVHQPGVLWERWKVERNA
jgi:hypothetical protein